MPEEYITTAEASQLSGYHKEYLRWLIRNGYINARKWGREWMVDRKSLSEYISKEKKPGPKPSSK